MFKFKSIKQKVVFVDVMIVLPLFIIFFIVLTIIFEESTFNLNHSKLDALEDKCRNVAVTNREIIQMSNSFFLDSEINSIMSKKKYESDYGYILDNRIVREKMRELTSSYAGGQYHMMLLCNNNVNYFQNSIEESADNFTVQDIKDEDWYDEMMESNGQIFFLPLYRSETFQKLFPDKALFAVRIMKNLNSGREVALLITMLSEEMWVNEVLDFRENGENSMVVDQYGKIVFASDTQIYGTEVQKNSYYDKITNYDKGFFLGNVNHEYSRIHFAAVPHTSWKLVEYSKYQYVWSKYVIVIILLGCMLLFVSVVMVRYNSNFIYRRTKTINENILKVSDGNLETRIIDDCEDEFRELSTNFNTMLDRIQMLMVQLELEEKEKYAHEMQALQAQINPHFLYNTVAAIRFMIQMGEHSEADRAMLSFSKLLRKSFADKRNMITIREELELASDYMELMKVRHQNTFQWKLDVDDETLELGILRNVIQPLVENSITHGFNLKQDMGHIVLRTVMEPDGVRIVIEDDGIGADLMKIKERLNSRNVSADKEQFNGIGIANVQMRIVRFFGKDYGLHARINESGGLSLELKLPQIELEVD